MGSFATKSYDYGNPFSMKMVNTGGVSGVEPEFIMESDPGVPLTAAKWRIKKILYDAGTNNANRILWAGGTNDFNKIANNYALYTYS
jgi:hypothetical protein